MKILINKHNPAIRITAPEIRVAGYYKIEGLSDEIWLSREKWTLVEEEPTEKQIDYGNLRTEIKIS